MNLERFEKFVDRQLHEPEHEAVDLRLTPQQAHELLLDIKQQLHAARVEGRIHEDTPKATLAGRHVEVNAWIERTRVLDRLLALEKMHEGQTEKTTAWEKAIEFGLNDLDRRVASLEADVRGRVGLTKGNVRRINEQLDALHRDASNQHVATLLKADDS